MNEATELPAVQPVQSFALVAVETLTRAARDAACDAAKMRELWAIQREMLDFSALSAFHRAFAAMQPELPMITRDGKLKTRGRDGREAISTSYATFSNINEAVKPTMRAHGFGVSFRPKTQNGQICVFGTLLHQEGHSDQADIVLPPDATGGKNAVQAVGSSISYAKRYLLTALLNISVEGEDTDGNPPPAETRQQPQATGAPGVATDAQVRLMRAKMRDAGMDEGQLKQRFGLQHLADMPFDQVNEALEYIRDPQVNS